MKYYNPSADKVIRTVDRRRKVNGYKQEMIRSKQTLLLRKERVRLILIIFTMMTS